MFIKRRKTRQVQVGPVLIGGGAPVAVQSMTTPDTANIKATVEQIHRLEEVGCEVVRVTVNTPEAAKALSVIKEQTTIPIIADIHFDYRLAVHAADVVDCVRINPGNIGAWWKVEEVVKAVRERNIPLRIGVNGGSLERELLAKYGYPTAEALAESALNAVRAIEDIGFTNMKVSLKASDVSVMVDAYRLFALQADYPLHLGVTEAGTLLTGSIKSSLGIGLLLADGIGDTIRVSLAADPVEEVKVGFEILKALELRHRGVNVIACPTCGRVEIDVIKLANEIEKRVGHIRVPLTVSVLGCVVNGIGEGKEADIGIAGGEGDGGHGILFKEGKLVRKVKAEDLMETLLAEIEIMAKERESGGGSDRNDNGHGTARDAAITAPIGSVKKEIPVLSL